MRHPMRLFGLFIAQDEGDVIRELLQFFRATRYYDKILFFDLGSRDNTFEIAQEFGDILHEPVRLNVPYSGRLRLDLLQRLGAECRAGDWISIIDADEFYAEDPRPLLEFAETEGSRRLETWQIMHYLTDLDIAAADHGDAAASVLRRLRYYLIHWSELRFYKFIPPSHAGGRCIDYEGKLCSRRLLNRHYPYRSPAQMQNKIDIRLENRRVGGNPQYQIFSEDWQDYVVDHRLLHRSDGEYRFGVPATVDWRSFYNRFDNTYRGWRNPAYNNTSIYWLMHHGFIPRWSASQQALRAVGKVVQRIRGRHRKEG